MIAQSNLPTPPPVAVIQRTLKKNQVHQFKIQVLSGSDLDPAKISYVFWAKTEIPEKSDDGTQGDDDLDFRIEDYTIQAEGLSHHSKLTGAGKLKITGSGLPAMLVDNIKDPKFWFPLVTLYLPPAPNGKDFDVDEIVSIALKMAGKGHIDGVKYSLDGSFKNGEREVGKFTLEWSIDKEGWPVSGKGSIKDADGSTSFTLGRS